MNIELRELDRQSGAVRHALQAVLEGAPTYYRRISGRDAPANAADEVIDSLPPGYTRENNWVGGIYLAETEELIGCIDLVRGYPVPETAMVGLLLLAERWQGRGLGEAAYLELERRVREWPEIRRMRISVLSTNAEVVPFWARLGFLPTGEQKPYENSGVVSVNIVFEKALSRS